MIYLMDAGCRRLLWIGKPRSEKTQRRGLKELTPEFVKGVCFVCGDM
jgi:transposase